uniref:BTB domain-containing protein n=1 Tax=Globodera rostochiensis TaxID=31243 RepID=A0A914GWL8_GLORO
MMEPTIAELSMPYDSTAATTSHMTNASQTEIRVEYLKHHWTVKNFSHCYQEYLENYGNGENNKDFQQNRLQNSEGRDIEMRIHPNPSHSDYVSYIKRDVLFPQIQPADSITVFVEIDVAVETVTTSVDDSCRLSKPCICEHQLGDDYLKLLNDGVLTDFTIRVVQEKDNGNDGGGKSGSSGGGECSTALQPQQNEVREIPVHKAILAARSPVFAAMLQHVDTSESKTGVLEIKDVECGVVKEMLNFIYSGKSSSPEINEIASDLLIAADKYRLEELKTHCEHCLIQAINFENACQLLIIADMYGAQFLRKRVLQFIMQHPKKITQTTLWHPLRNRADLINPICNSFPPALIICYSVACKNNPRWRCFLSAFF